MIQVTDQNQNSELIIVTGMSGAGRTEAMHVFEDMGYFCVDNLPPTLIEELVASAQVAFDKENPLRIAVVCDVRARGFLNAACNAIDTMRAQGVKVTIVYLDADDDRLIARYKSSRRRHPLCDDGTSISKGIERERMLLKDMRSRADYTLNTTDMLPAELHNNLTSLFTEADKRLGLSVSVYSFGFKHGAPADADLVIDVRFLPNPYYDPEMRTMTGLDKPVHDYVIYNADTETFLSRWYALLDCVMPGYVAEGKQQLAIAVGCTGGQHRSVAIAEATGGYLRRNGYRVSVAHRDLSLAEKANGQLVNAEFAASDLGSGDDLSEAYNIAFDKMPDGSTDASTLGKHAKVN